MGEQRFFRGERRAGEANHVTLDGHPLRVEPSLALRGHSPTGFEWGYGGSGPAQRALAILIKVTDQATALSCYHQFKFDVIALFDADRWVLSVADVERWLASQADGTLAVRPKHDEELGQEVIEHLDGLDRQAHEEGIEISAPVRAEVERILRTLDTRRMLPYDVDVSPCEDGQVAIEVRSAGAAFTLYCEPDRSALCLVTVNRVSRRARYQDSGRLPDCFVEEALRDLADQS